MAKVQKNVFLFPGQGSQAVGMAKELSEAFPLVRATFDEADQALDEKLSDLIWTGPEEKIRETANAQPAILTVSVAIGRVLLNAGVRPEAMAGHSLGEYSALVLSNAMDFADAVRVVRKRGVFMQEAVPLGVGTMSAVLGMDDAVVEDVCREVSNRGHVVEPANYNCPGQLVISGEVAAVAQATELLKQKGCKRIIPLQVSAPFHSTLLKPAGERLANELKLIQFRDPKVPYIANVDCEVVETKEAIPLRLTEQVWKPVRWTQSLTKIVERFSPDRIVEVGPGKVISGHVKKVAPQLTTFLTDRPDLLGALLE